MNKLHNFYCSKAWRDLAHLLKIQRGFKCERTGEVFEKESDLIAHHKVELTESNVDDASISLNPKLIEIISFAEHNKEHRRFGSHKQNVYVVYGSPLSGKTTMVRDMMRSGDIVCDIDSLWEAVVGEKNIKPNNIRYNVFRLRDGLIDQIKTRYGKWCDAYVIGGYPNKVERERVAASLKAEMIYCEATKEECHKRRIQSGKPEVWDEYIKNWWEEYRA